MMSDELKLLPAPKEPRYGVSELRKQYLDWYAKDLARKMDLWWPQPSAEGSA